MKPKKIIILLIAIVLVSICIICLGFMIFSMKQDDKYIKTANENDISRYEWMEMLCEQSGLTEYQKAEPYYEDVNADSPYFSYIQSAVEWNVLSGNAAFEGDGYASGSFVALTAMKSIGERKLMMYLDTEDVIADDTYLKLAMEHGLIDKEQLKEGVSTAECEQILASLKDLYFNEFWRDDYSRVTYQEGVIELSPDEVMRSNKDGTEIVVSDKVRNTLEIGTVIVFEEETTKLKYARKIIGIDSDGTLSLGSVELDQVVESLAVSDIETLTYEKIVNYYEEEENVYTSKSLEYRKTDEKLINTEVFPIDKKSEGFKLSLCTKGEKDDRHLEIQITNNATGKSKELPLHYKVEEDSEYSAEIDIKEILIGGQVSYDILQGGLQYADVAIDVDSTFKGTIKAEEEKKIPLLKTPVSLGNGLAGVEIQIYIVLSMEGNITFEAEIPVEVSLYFEKDKGFRNFKHEILPKNIKAEANCDAEAVIRIEPTIFILWCLDVADVEADVGVEASAKVTTHPTSQVCADISVSFPVITISVGGDDDADTLIGKKGWSAEWKIFSANREEDGALFQAPLQLELHFERLPDQPGQYVAACTYKEEQNEDDSLHTYFTKQGDTKFAFDYPDGWTIDAAESESWSRSFKEAVVLRNDRDALLQYWEQKDNYPLGGAGNFLSGVEVTKAADSSLEGFIVGKIKCISTVDYVDYLSKEELPLEDGPEMYAVIPKDDVGTNYYGGAYFADYLSFAYRGSTYYFAVDAPEGGKFTEEEENEVIAILSSFREVEKATAPYIAE